MQDCARGCIFVEQVYINLINTLFRYHDIGRNRLASFKVYTYHSEDTKVNILDLHDWWNVTPITIVTMTLLSFSINVLIFVSV